MKLLVTIQEQDINPGAPQVDTSGFTSRQATRAVVVNDEGQVALVNVANSRYHKLPGGGVEAEEDFEQTLQRELMEEIGCKVEVRAEIGQIIEYRDQNQEKQTSYCFLARQIGTQHIPSFTHEEVERGFEMVWAAGIEDAIHQLEKDQPVDYEGRFIRQRDLAFLAAAKELQ